MDENAILLKENGLKTLTTNYIEKSFVIFKKWLCISQ